MSPEALVTVFSVAIAAFAIVPTEKRLDLQIRLQWFDYLLVTAGIALVHYILFLPVLRELDVAPDLGAWRWGLTNELATYAIIAVLALYVILRAKKGRLGRRGIFRFKELTERLLFARRYSELIFLLERNFPQLVRISHNNFWQPRLRKKLAPPPYVDISRLQREAKPRYRMQTAIAKKAGGLLHSFNATAEAANETLHRALLSDGMQFQIATVSPYFGTQVLGHIIPQRLEFQDKWIWALLEDRASVIYYEIEHNQNLHPSSSRRYCFHPENRILHFYFHDAKVAHDLHVCAPVAEFLHDYLDRLNRDLEQDRYSQSLDLYYEKDRWRCPVHACLRIFEFAVSEALYQDIPWHMGLFELTHVVSKIIRNLDPDPSVDMTAEWPTPYHHMLYEIVSMLTDWIRGAAEVGNGHRNSVMKSTRLDHENNNIPKSSVIVLGFVLAKIFRSQVVGVAFQAYILEIVLREIGELEGHPRASAYSELLVEAIAHENLGTPSKTYADIILSLIDGSDTRVRFSSGAKLGKRIAELLAAN